MSKPLQFQKKALEYSHKNLDLDEALQVICPKSWLFILVILSLIILFIVWLIWGKIYLRTEGKGILLSTYSSTITLQAPPLEGSVVKKIVVEPGQRINKDTKVMVINNEIEAQLKYQKIYLQQIQRQYELLSVHAKEAIQNLETSEGEQIKKVNLSLEAAQEKLEQINIILKLKEQALKKGILDLPNITETRIEYFKLLQEIRAHEAELISKKADLLDIRDKWRERERDLLLAVNKAEYDFNILQMRWQNAHYSVSPVQGIVSEIKVKEGDHLKPGEPLISITPDSNHLYALIFVPASQGKSIKIGMDAKVAVSFLNKFEYGTIKGQVTEISPLPISPEYMMTFLKNTPLVRYFGKQEPMLAVKITLTKNDQLPSGYQWTSSQGPSLQLTQGTLVEAVINLKAKTPIKFLLHMAN